MAVAKLAFVMKTSLTLLGVFIASMLARESHECVCPTADVSARAITAAASTSSTGKSPAAPAREQKTAPKPAGGERQREVRRPRPEYLFL